jgi:CHASE3 domain sensor protein
MRSGADRRRGRGLRATPVAGVRLSREQRIAAIGGLAGIVLLLGLLTYWGLTSVSAARASVGRTHRAIEASQAVLQDLTDAETGERGFLITGDERYLQPYRAAITRLAADTVSLRTFTSVDGAQQRALDSLSAAIHYKVDELARTIALMRTAGPEAARIEVDKHLG